MAVRVIISRPTDDDPGIVEAKIATLNNERQAVTWNITAQTNNIYQYVADNEVALEAQILAEGTVNEELTAKLRARDARQLLEQSRLEGTTLAQVENYIEVNVTNLATAKEALKEVAGQVWMLYQVAGLTLEVLD